MAFKEGDILKTLIDIKREIIYNAVNMHGKKIGTDGTQ